MDKKEDKLPRTSSASPILSRMLRDLSPERPNLSTQKSEVHDVATQTVSFNTMHEQYQQYRQYFAYYQRVFWLAQANNMWSNLYQLNHLRNATQHPITLYPRFNQDLRQTTPPMLQRHNSFSNYQSRNTPMVSPHVSTPLLSQSSTNHRLFINRQRPSSNGQYKILKRKSRVTAPTQSSTQNFHTPNLAESTSDQIQQPKIPPLPMISPQMQKVITHIDRKNDDKNALITKHRLTKRRLPNIPQYNSHVSQPSFHTTIPTTTHRHDTLPPISTIFSTIHVKQPKRPPQTKKEDPLTSLSQMIETPQFLTNTHQDCSHNSPNSSLNDIILQPLDEDVDTNQHTADQTVTDKDMTSMNKTSSADDCDHELKDIKPIDLSHNNE